MRSLQKVLITGAAGFVGPYLAKELKDAYNIVAVDRKQDGSFGGLDGIVYEALDVVDKEAVAALVEKHLPDAIIHLAAETSGWFEAPYAMLSVNLSGVVNLYEAVCVQKQRCGYNPKIIYVSTSETYGHAAGSQPITEDTRLTPVNHYSVSKASADLLSYDYVQSNGLNIVIARPFTHTGPGQRAGFFVPDIASQVARAERTGERRLFVGNIDAIRDYSDVRDVVHAYRLLLEASTNPGEAYNICSGTGVKVKDLLDMIVSRSEVEIVVELDQKRLRPSDTPVFIGDNTKLKKATGWQPRYGLQQTVDDTLKFWRLHEVTKR